MRSFQVAAAAVLVAALAACGGSGGSSDAGAGNGPGSKQGDAGSGNSDTDGGSAVGPTLTVVFDVTGEETIAGEVTALPSTDNGKSPGSCPDYAKGNARDDGTTSFVLPSFLNGPVAGKKILIGTSVPAFTGPGTYPQSLLSGPGGSTVSVDSRAYAVEPDTTTGQLVVDDKGGGTWAFDRLAFSDGDGTVSKGISGKISWTCADR